MPNDMLQRLSQNGHKPLPVPEECETEWIAIVNSLSTVYNGKNDKFRKLGADFVKAGKPSVHAWNGTKTDVDKLQNFASKCVLYRDFWEDK